MRNSYTSERNYFLCLHLNTMIRKRMEHYESTSERRVDLNNDEIPLPQELILHLFEYLGTRGLCSLQLTSKKWFDMV